MKLLKNSATRQQCRPILFVNGRIASEFPLVHSIFEVRSPIKRGDIEQVISVNNRKSPGMLLIADGLFHSTESVSLSEIDSALRVGWQVVGLGSIGALRAIEASRLGMRGVGTVYRWVRLFKVENDDEVAQTYDPSNFYPLSEPLVNIRGFLGYLARIKIVTVFQRQAILNEIKKLYYPYRSYYEVWSRISEANTVNFPTDSERLKIMNGFLGPKEKDIIKLTEAFDGRYSCQK